LDSRHFEELFFVVLGALGALMMKKIFFLLAGFSTDWARKIFLRIDKKSLGRVYPVSEV
jgi:hypothetical protein